MPLFEGFSPDVLGNLGKQMTVRQHPQNQTIILQDDWGSSVYFVVEGWVKIRTYNIDGKEVTLNILGPGEVVGEMAALDESPRSTDVISLTEAKVALLPAKTFVDFLEADSACGVRLAQLISRRLRQINRRLQLRESGSNARVVDILLFLAEFRGRVSRAGVEIPNLPHRELGSLSGLARETVTRILGKLETKGLIQRDRDRDIICIPSMDDLEDLLI
ncbi:MAG: Crp/Fnr family transcriptional regulator [Synechococcus sp.]